MYPSPRSDSSDGCGTISRQFLLEEDKIDLVTDSDSSSSSDSSEEEADDLEPEEP
jgi:hypothetical protein